MADLRRITFSANFCGYYSSPSVLRCLFCVRKPFTSCNSAHLEPLSLLRTNAEKQRRHVLQSLEQTVAFRKRRVLVPALLVRVGDFKKRTMKSALHSLSLLQKRRTYLFSEIPNYERQNLAGRCALLSSSWLLFAWVYLPADFRDVTEIHFTTVATSRPNPVTV